MTNFIVVAFGYRVEIVDIAAEDMEVAIQKP